MKRTGKKMRRVMIDTLESRVLRQGGHFRGGFGGGGLDDGGTGTGAGTAITQTVAPTDTTGTTTTTGTGDMGGHAGAGCDGHNSSSDPTSPNYVPSDPNATVQADLDKITTDRQQL